MSLETKNHKLFKYEDNDVADLRFLHDSMDTIDNGLNPFYVATQSGANTYKVITGANKTSLANGYSVKVAIPSASNGAVSIIIDTCNAVAVKKPNGNTVTNFKANGVYSLTYYNSVFILASGGVDDVNFSASDLLTGKSANNSDGEKVNGTMKNVGQQTATINAGGKVIITKGYHDGTGYIQSNTMAKQLSDLGSTLTSAKQLVKGVKAVDKTGKLITGTADVYSLGGVYKVVRHIELSEIAITIENTITARINLTLPVTPRAIKFYGKLHYQENTYKYDYYVNVDAIGWKLDGDSDIVFFNTRGNNQKSNGATISDLIVASGATFTNIATSTIKDSQVYCEYMY